MSPIGKERGCGAVARVLDDLTVCDRGGSIVEAKHEIARTVIQGHFDIEVQLYVS